jgi:hypothetical protein
MSNRQFKESTALSTVQKSGAKVDMNRKTINIGEGVGHGTWGAIDYLCAKCGYLWFSK